MFQVGDVIQYEASRRSNEIPGFVVGIVYDRRGNRDCLEVQWFDWEPGELAHESEEALVLLSSVVSEGK